MTMETKMKKTFILLFVLILSIAAAGCLDIRYEYTGSTGLIR